MFTICERLPRTAGMPRLSAVQTSRRSTTMRRGQGLRCEVTIFMVYVPYVLDNRWKKLIKFYDQLKKLASLNNKGLSAKCGEPLGRTVPDARRRKHYKYFTPTLGTETNCPSTPSVRWRGRKKTSAPTGAGIVPFVERLNFP